MTMTDTREPALSARPQLQAERDAHELASTDLAVIAMTGRFPGAQSVDALWRMLKTGGSGIADVEETTHKQAEHSAFVGRSAMLEGSREFDADFFRLPAHEALLMDPQQRVFLEVCWQALAESGHAGETDRLRIGVFAATSLSSYLLGPLRRAGAWDDDVISHPVLIGNDKDFLCSRVSYLLGLRGPSVVVQSACSGSLTALHMARQSLLQGDCDLAIVGGVSITPTYDDGYLHQEGGILSPDGHCRVFDAEAGGTVKGSGAAVVVLRRLDAALAERDVVHAVVAGTAVNNDGSQRAGYAAPGVAGQTAVIRAAMRAARLSASQMGYVEAHGTGTRLGDPIELRALSAAYAADGNPPERCWLGSVKSALGHLDAAAGVTGLIKAALVLREATVPVQTSFTTPNPLLALDQGPFEVPRATFHDRTLMAAGVSSFGLGGANAHAVLVRGPEFRRSPVPHGPHTVLLSARDDEALRERAAVLAEWLDKQPSARVDDIALSAQTGQQFAVRQALEVCDIADLREQLAAVAEGREVSQPATAADWSRGSEPPAPEFLGDLRVARRVALPAHPLRQQTFWLDGAADPSPRHSAGADGSREREDTAAGKTREEAVLAIVRSELADVDAGPDDDLLQLGMDSMAAIGILSRVRDELGLDIPFDEVVRARTVRALLATSVSARNVPSGGGGNAPADAPDEDIADDGTLTTLRSSETSSDELFLVHPAGGTTIVYLDMTSALPDDVTVHALSYPSGAAGTRPSIRDLATQYVRQVRRVRPEGPYLLGGYSFGGNVAVEMALQLEAAGQRVERVLLLDSHTPEAYVGTSCEPDAYLTAFADLLRRLFPELADRPDPVATTPRGVLDAMVDGTGLAWGETMRAQLTAFFDVWVDNHVALKGWYPDRPVAAPLHMLEASEPEPPAVLKLLDIRLQPAATWERHTTGGLEIRPVPGDHYSLMRDPAYVPVLAAEVSRGLRG